MGAVVGVEGKEQWREDTSLSNAGQAIKMSTLGWNPLQLRRWEGDGVGPSILGPQQNGLQSDMQLSRVV